MYLDDYRDIQIPEEHPSTCYTAKDTLQRMWKAVPHGLRIQLCMAMLALPVIVYQCAFIPRHALLSEPSIVESSHLAYVSVAEKAKIDEMWRQQLAAIRPTDKAGSSTSATIAPRSSTEGISLDAVHLQSTLEHNDFALFIDGTNSKLKCVLFTWAPREKHFELNGKTLRENIQHEGSHLTRPYTYPAWSLSQKGKYTLDVKPALAQCFEFAQTLLGKIGLGALARVRSFPVQFLGGSPMRVLDLEARDALLRDIRVSLDTSPFYCMVNSVRLVTASEEAALGWAALHGLNIDGKALLRHQFPPADGTPAPPFYAGHLNVQENGVFSSFQPDPAHPFGEHGYSLSFGGVAHKVFAHGFLSAGWTNVARVQPDCLPSRFIATDHSAGTGDVQKCLREIDSWAQNISSHIFPEAPLPWHLTTVRFAPVSEGSPSTDQSYLLGDFNVVETHQYVRQDGDNLATDYGSQTLTPDLSAKVIQAMHGSKGVVLTSLPDRMTAILQPVRFVGTGEWSKVLPLMKVARNSVTYNDVLASRDTVCAYSKSQLDSQVSREPSTVSTVEHSCFFLAHASAILNALTRKDFTFIIPSLNSQTTVNIASGAALEQVNSLPWSIKPSPADVKLVRNLLFWKNVVVKLVFLAGLGLLAWFISGIINAYDNNRRQAIFEAQQQNIDPEAALEALPGPVHIMWESICARCNQLYAYCCGYSSVDDDYPPPSLSAHNSRSKSAHNSHHNSHHPSSSHLHKTRRIQEITHHYLSQGYPFAQAEIMAKREFRQERKDNKTVETTPFLPPPLPVTLQKSGKVYRVDQSAPFLSSNVSATTAGVDRDFARHARMQQQQQIHAGERASSPFVAREQPQSPFIMKPTAYNKHAIIASTPVLKPGTSPLVKGQSVGFQVLPDHHITPMLSLDGQSDDSDYDFDSDNALTVASDRRGRSRGRDL